MKNSFGFLFKKSSLPKSDLNALLSVEEFVSKADEILANGKGIEDIDIYNIARELYFPMLRDFETEGFKAEYKQRFGSDKYKEWSIRFRILGKATRRISNTLFDSDKWKDDYIEYKTSDKSQ